MIQGEWESGEEREFGVKVERKSEKWEEKAVSEIEKESEDRSREGK